MNEVSKLIDRTITDVVLDSTVTTIGDYAFDHCSSLTSVTIPSGVTSIGQGAFYYCSKLNELHFTNNTPPTIVGSPWYGLKYAYVPEGSVETYRTAFINKIYKSDHGGYALDPSTFVFSYQVPYWEEQSFECEVDETDTKTGMVTVVEKDTNPSSPTYNQARARTYEDLKRCNPVSGFTKITSLDEATSGKYLIVNTSVNKALNASLIKDTTTATSGINTANNMIDVTIENDIIAQDDNTLNAAVDYDADNKTLSWTDSDTGTTYYLYWNGSGAKFAYNGNMQPSTQYPMEAKYYENFGSFSFANSTRLVGYNNENPRFNFYLPNNGYKYESNMALFKLNQ